MERHSRVRRYIQGIYLWSCSITTENNCEKRGSHVTLPPCFLRINEVGTGYHTVMLCKNGTKLKRLVHRIVAKTFLENPDNKPVVDHLNGDKTDNRLCNLKWATHSENQCNEITKARKRQVYIDRGRPIVQLKMVN